MIAPVAVIAQAPSSINGSIIEVQVTSGSGIFADRGWFTLILNRDSNTYNIIGWTSDVIDSNGSFTYSGSGNIGTLNINDSATGIVSGISLSFTSSTSGTYQLSNQFGHQTGAFFAMLPNARGYPTVRSGMNLGYWVYFGNWPWVYIAGSGWAYLWPEADGLYVLPAYNFPIFCLETPGT